MRYLDAFRDPQAAAALAGRIHAEARGRAYRLMEFCGGHTHAIHRCGLEDLLPASVTMIHGPGCPVCVLPTGRLDMAIALAERPGVTLATYADMMRVPGSNGASLLKAKAAGADVRMVYSSLQALELAEGLPDREVVFFAIGFETTTPPTAALAVEARRRGLGNLSIFCNHVLTPAAIDAIMEAGGEEARLDGFVGPGHVSMVIGAEAYAPIARRWERPIVLSGFEANDILNAVLLLVRQINAGEARVENAFARAVRPGGNAKAQALCTEVFTVRETFEWRGLGEIAESALRLSGAYADLDAERRFGLPYVARPDHRACACADVLRGLKTPADCQVFGHACTPEHPLGSCMVSPEGACAAHYAYGRFRDARGAA